MARRRSRALGGPPKTFLKASWYSVMAAIRATAASRLGWPISTGLTIGSAACSSSVFTRPSQNCVLLESAFRMVGALRWPIRPLIPTEVGLPRPGHRQRRGREDAYDGGPHRHGAHCSGRLVLVRDQRCVHEVLGDEPDLPLVGPDHVAHQQIVGAVIAGLRSLPRHRARLFEDDLVRMKQPRDLH